MEEVSSYMTVIVISESAQSACGNVTSGASYYQAAWAVGGVCPKSSSIAALDRRRMPAGHRPLFRGLRLFACASLGLGRIYCLGPRVAPENG